MANCPWRRVEFINSLSEGFWGKRTTRVPQKYTFSLCLRCNPSLLQLATSPVGRPVGLLGRLAWAVANGQGKCTLLIPVETVLHPLSSRMTTLVLEAITKRFSAEDVLSSISFSVEKGERIAVAGQSGSGKTTLLRIIAGLEQPTSGRLKLGEVDATKWPANRRKMAMVFQDYATYPRLSVAENLTVAFVGGSVPKAEKETRLQEIVQWLELDGLLGRLPTELSGGQLQRVALGKALMARPDILLLDEPFSQLDVRLADQLRRLLEESHRRYGMTQIMVTHNPLDAMCSVDKLAVLERGRLVQFASPEEVRRQPQTRFAAELTSLCGLNFVPTALVERAGRSADLCIAFRPEDVHRSLPDSAAVAEYVSIRCKPGVVRNLGVVCLQEAHLAEHRILAACSPDTRQGDGQEATWFVRHDDVLTFSS